MVNRSLRYSLRHGIYIAGSLVLLAANARAQPVITTYSPGANAQAPRTSAVTTTFSQPLTAGSAAALRVYSAQRGGAPFKGSDAADRKRQHSRIYAQRVFFHAGRNGF
jgi:hypothetical protein